MGINSQITATAILTLAIAGCTIGETPEATNTPPAPTPQDTAQTPPSPAPFPSPLVSPPVKSTTVAGGNDLIPSTNIDLQQKIIQPGRRDPFAEIVKPPIGQGTTPLTISSTRPVPTLPPLPTTQKPQTGSTGVNTPGGGQLPTTPNGVGRPGGTTGTIATVPKPKPPVVSQLPKVLPQPVPNPKITPVLPPQPQPETARAVVVSGVVLIGRQPQAIIKVPEEPTSRYVQAGQRLGNGVLIKRIEMNGGSNPIVIFEQYGIEVAKGVGEKPVSEPSKTAASSAISMGTPL
ncbi:hypothetical protein A0J48_014990 [Sphaerospermopsis aphanizomenoides BCCUSP55]|nr:hypothetical protein [Sphaerospermopsis aphanizomenoides BCCUSP55]